MACPFCFPARSRYFIGR